ncbi:hypothetical protein HYX18_00120 [Candidatus Woesearchaeota archaeon]|nr:hypothetical protein [Candidatus Woesearchaeota archaeon]
MEYDSLLQQIRKDGGKKYRDTKSLKRIEFVGDVPISDRPFDGYAVGSTAWYKKQLTENTYLFQMRRDFSAFNVRGNNIRIVAFSTLAELKGDPEDNENFDTLNKLSKSLDELVHNYCKSKHIFVEGYINLLPYENIDL